MSGVVQDRPMPVVGLGLAVFRQTVTIRSTATAELAGVSTSFAVGQARHA